ncbi:MAG TPA: ABC transporter ATP-binding protein [Rhodocyclaceae bacterium]|jgi:ABC-type multidrug transport system fused ATPase/permease subunit
MMLLRKLGFVVGRKHRSAYLRLLLLLLAGALFEALGVGGVLPFLAALSDAEKILANPHVVRLLDLLELSRTTDVLVQLTGLAMVGLMVMKGLVAFWASRSQVALLFKERARITQQLFGHYMLIPYSQHLNKNMAEVIHLATGVSTTFTTVYMAALLTIVTETMVSLALLAMLMLINAWAVFVVGVLTVLVGWTYMALTRARSRRLGEQQHRVVIATNKCLIEGLSALKEVRVYGAASHFLSRLEKLNHAYTAVSTSTTIFNQMPRLITETAFMVAVIGSVMYLSYVGFDLKQVIPLLVVFGMAFMRIMPSFNRILTAFTVMRLNESALDMLYRELTETDYDTSPDALIARPERAASFDRAIELNDLNYTYPGAPAPSLAGITLSIRKGQTIALVGKSGSGKTTLIDILLGLLRPSCGELTIDGHEVMDLSGLQGVVGYIPQSIYLTDDTLRRNVAFGVDDDAIDEEAIRRAVHAAQLDAYVDTLPEGLDSTVGDRGVRLSGGQRQRVGIARALYRDPAILVLDEATSALDVETEVAVTDAIRELGKHKTLIVVAHRLSTVRDCEVLYLLEEGKIVAQGSYDELVRQNKWFSKISELNSASH